MSTNVVGEFAAPLWRHSGEAAWCFVTLPVALADDLRASAEPVGFGSVRVTVTVGSTTWRTSVFPDSSSGSYVLPVKAAVRRAERLAEGSVLEVRLVTEPG